MRSVWETPPAAGGGIRTQTAAVRRSAPQQRGGRGKGDQRPFDLRRALPAGVRRDCGESSTNQSSLLSQPVPVMCAFTPERDVSFLFNLLTLLNLNLLLKEAFPP